MNTERSANTERSDALVERFRQQPFKATRKFIGMHQTFPARADEVFVLLCPSREADWIPGWDCELVFTESGYAEEHCVFRTDETCVSGPGVWVMNHHEPPHLLEIARFTPDMVVDLKIALSENADGTTDGAGNVYLLPVDWDLTLDHYCYLQNAIGRMNGLAGAMPEAAGSGDGR